ncbi:MAG: hypothetical protein Q4C67_05820 [Deinococcus sp.]|nr:hypothetical protein [Deinococcus sp.]
MSDNPKPSSLRPALALVFVGSSLLWFAQFNAVYALAENACNTAALHGQWLSLPLWMWLSVAVTLLLGGAVAWLGLRGYQEALDPGALQLERRERQAFMGRVGAMIAVMYLLVMAFSLVLTLMVPPCR